MAPYDVAGNKVQTPMEGSADSSAVGPNSLLNNEPASTGLAPECTARGARWWCPPIQPCVRLLKVSKQGGDEDRAACLHALAAFAVPAQVWLRSADVRVSEGSKLDWWSAGAYSCSQFSST
jgi:hypothetical protein